MTGALTHPIVQSTLVPAFVCALAWLSIRFVLRRPQITPMAGLLAVLSTYLVVFGWPKPMQLTGLDKFACLLVLSIVVIGLQPRSGSTGKWGIALSAAWLVAGFSWIILPTSLTIWALGAAVLTALSIFCWSNSEQFTSGAVFPNELPSALFLIALAVLALQAGSASLFQLVIAFLVSHGVMQLGQWWRPIERDGLAHGVAVFGPMMLLAAYAWRYLDISIAGMTGLLLIMLSAWVAPRVTERTSIQAVLMALVGIVAIAAIVLWGAHLETIDDAYY